MTIRATVRGQFYEAFYRLPWRWRRRLVRLGTAKFTVGAVVLVREPAGAGQPRIVLLRQPPGHGWSLPAGLLKRGETSEAGAARELLEETGLPVRPEDLRPLNPSALVHTNGRWIDVVFEARVPLDTPFVVDGSEVHEAAWHRLDALPPLTSPTARLLGRYGIGPLASAPSAEMDNNEDTSAGNG